MISMYNVCTPAANMLNNNKVYFAVRTGYCDKDDTLGLAMIRLDLSSLWHDIKANTKTLNPEVFKIYKKSK